MKRCVTVVLIACLLCGCGGKSNHIEQALELRKELLSANSCSFEATVTADYGVCLYTFQMDCSVNPEGSLSFTVKDPETIAGITGTITNDDASLTFDNKVLSFPTLVEGQLTPVSAPWLFINALKGGYITGYSEGEEESCIFIDDSFAENTLSLEVYCDSQFQPQHVDFYWMRQRVLSADIRNFSIQ